MEYKLKDFDKELYAKYVVFLDTVKVLKMLYGSAIAEKFFTKNMSLFYDDDSESQN